MTCSKRCGCKSKCNCLIQAGDCTTVSGNGSVDVPYEINVEVAECDNNAIECLAEGEDSDDGQCSGPGLYAPAFSIEPGPCVDIIDDGAGGKTISVDVCDDTDPEGRHNFLECVPEDTADPEGGEGGSCLSVPLSNDAGNTTGVGTDGGIFTNGADVNVLDTTTVDMEIAGAGTQVDPFVLSSTVNPGCGLRVAGAGDGAAGPGLAVDTLFSGAGAHRSAIQEHSLDPAAIDLGQAPDCDDFSGAAVYCDPDGRLRVPAYLQARSVSIERQGTTSGCMCDIPSNAPATFAGGTLIDNGTGSINLVNTSDCYFMDITIDTNGRTRLDVIPDECWPAAPFSYTASVVLAVDVQPILNGWSIGTPGEYAVQRAQFERNTGPCITNPCANAPYEGFNSQSWSDHDKVPSIRLNPGGGVMVTRHARAFHHGTDVAAVCAAWIINHVGISITGASRKVN